MKTTLILSLRHALVVAVGTWLASPVPAQTAGQDGQWTEPFELPLIAIHAAMLPTDQVLLFGSGHGVPGIHAWVLDPDSLQLSNVEPPWDLFCSGHSFLADGRLLVAGGSLQEGVAGGEGGHPGTDLVYAFNPDSLQWEQAQSMNGARWYPSNITLPDGRAVTMTGLDTEAQPNLDIEAYDPAANVWQVIGEKELPLYPRLHVISSGLVFKAGPDAQSETFDPESGIWTPVAETNAPARFEAPSVLLPPTFDQVMVIGGSLGPESGAPTSSAEIIDLSQKKPQWRVTSHMSFPRREHNAVILPDGKIFVVGGRTDTDDSPNPVLTPEIFDPAAETWDQVAPHQVPRMYHSTATLLLDGRVLVAGGNCQPTGELYSPGYLFRGARPVINEAQRQVSYGSTFELDFTSSTKTNTVAMIRLSSVTHSVNFGQRYVLLAQLSSGSAVVNVPAPASANLAPPGFYMLFVVDEDGVPSKASLVQLVGDRLGDLDGDGVVGVADLLLLLAAWGPCADCDDCPADLNGDCTVGVADLLILFANWGRQA